MHFRMQHQKRKAAIMLTKAELPECPVATTVQLIGNKWKMLILRNLMMRPWRFNEMLRSIPGLSQKVLTDNLRALEADGLITRTVYPRCRPGWNMPSPSWARPCGLFSARWKAGETAISSWCATLERTFDGRKQYFTKTSKYVIVYMQKSGRRARCFCVRFRPWTSGNERKNFP